MQTTIARAKTCVLNAQQRQKHYYDKRHVPSVFDGGAEVLLAITNLHLRTTGTRSLYLDGLGLSRSWPAWAAQLCSVIYVSAFLQGCLSTRYTKICMFEKLIETLKTVYLARSLGFNFRDGRFCLPFGSSKLHASGSQCVS